MALHLDVISHQPGLSTDGNAESVARVIGEILPFVLAKYGVSSSNTKEEKMPQADRTVTRNDRLPSRFDRSGEVWK